MTKVPFLNLRSTYDELKSEIDEAILRVLDSGWYILGNEVESFEFEWANYCGAENCVAVGNGLDALRLSLTALGLEAGDEVIVPSNTYIATWLAVSHCGATIVPVEPNPLTHNIDPNLIEAAITNRTKCIMPVHLYGLPAEIETIVNIAKKYHLYVVEDAAQAHGSLFKGERIGGHGDIVCWSFYPGKNLGAFGDAGAITTNNLEIAEKIKSLRNYGSPKKYVNDLIGYNSRLDPIQAAILRVKLKYLSDWIERRSKFALIYLDRLSSLGGALPLLPSHLQHAWHLFVIKTSQRDKLQSFLADNQISTIIHYPIPPHKQQAYKHSAVSRIPCPISESLAKQVISLPIGPHFSLEAIEYVSDNVLSFFKQHPV